MDFLTRNQDLRADPSKLLPGAKSALVFGFNYYQGDRATYYRSTPEPRVAQYARLRDYHRFLKDCCTKIGAACHTQASNFRVLVDSAPVLERAIARKSGSGFIGKNTCFISPTHGSFVLLAEILSTEIEPQPHASSPDPIDPNQRSARGGCGTCQRCQVHCPTGALDSAWQLDANRCLSYWTIEHRGTVPFEYWPHFKLYWFGCDICQLVCPWNRHATVAHRTDLARITEKLNLAEVATMDQPSYERMFGGSPMTRAKIAGLRRNALIAMAVTGHVELPQVLRLTAQDPDPVLVATTAQVQEWLADSSRHPQQNRKLPSD